MIISESKSDYLQNPTPYEEKEQERLTELFVALHKADEALTSVETRRGEGRSAELAEGARKATRVATESMDATDLITGGATVASLESNAAGAQIDREFNAAQQGMLDGIFRVVEFLRTRDEYFAWECDLSPTISALSMVHGLYSHLAGGQGNAALLTHLAEEIQQHGNQSSELFLRTAQGHRAAEPGAHEQLVLMATTASVCSKAFSSLRADLRKELTFPEGAELLILSVKNFGRAFKNWKMLASSLTTAQTLGPLYAMRGVQLQVEVPELEK